MRKRKTKRRETAKVQPKRREFPHARQFAAAISGYGLTIGRSRSIAGCSLFLFFFFSLILSFVHGSVSLRHSFRTRQSGPWRDMATFNLLCSPLLLVVTLFTAALTSSVNVVTASTSSVSSASDYSSPIEPLSPTVELPDSTGGKKALVGTLCALRERALPVYMCEKCAEFVLLQ